MNWKALLFGTPNPVPPTLDAPFPRGTSPAGLARVFRRVLAASGFLLFSRDFQGVPFDLNLIDTAYREDSYVRRAVDKHIELIFKAGWQLVGRNPRAVSYVRTRLAVMAEATGTPTDSLLMGIAEQLVRYANALVIKQRDDNYPWPRGLRVRPLGNRAPVVGYFLVHPGEMMARRDRYGNIRRWRQSVGNETKDFPPDDVIHLSYARNPGELFGYPFLLSAISDVRALRQAEEQVLRLIYRNLFPFLHAIVGTAEVPGNRAEVEQLQAQLNAMELEGGLATTERVKLSPVAVDQIIDASRYLTYFEKRVFTALGVSETLMGRAETASRAAADTISVEMRDRIKAFQRILQVGIDHFIVNELLREGGFDPIGQDDVDFVFNEIDIDAKVKTENHTVFLYEHNAITEDEMRGRLGMDPLDDAQRQLLYLFRVRLPQLLASKGLWAPPLEGASSEKDTAAPDESDDWIWAFQAWQHDLAALVEDAPSTVDRADLVRIFLDAFDMQRLYMISEGGRASSVR